MLSNEARLQVVGLYQSGKTVQDINKMTGISVSSIRNILNDAGIYKSRGAGQPQRRVNRDIINLYQQGLIPSQIADKLNITTKTVINHLKQSGLYEDGRRFGNNRRDK